MKKATSKTIKRPVKVKDLEAKRNPKGGLTPIQIPRRPVPGGLA
jgi:hypothetical protein